MSFDLLPPELPQGQDLVAAGRELATTFDVGISAFCRQHGVRSEVEYKQKMIAAGRLMTALTIGMQSWDQTRRALQSIYDETERRGFYIDRFILPIDRRMGIPPEHWASAAKETGPLIETPDDWAQIASAVPIQPHMGDMMIGSPMSVPNTIRGLTSGVNYIGNVGQFPWKYPNWRGTEIEQSIETVKALGIMAGKRADGAVVHDYLDDGFPAQFSDFSSYVGWAMFDRYVIRELCGANITVSYGGLTQEPASKAAMILALESLKSDLDVPTSFYYTTTTGLSTDIESNYGALGVDTLVVLLTIQRVGGGAAVNPVPVTEPLRIPSWDEIVAAHAVARRVAVDAERLRDFVDWGPLLELSERLTAAGRRFYENVLNGLGDLGVRVDDPLQCLAATRKLGAVEIERRWGAGRATDDPQFIGYEPVVATDTLTDFLRKRNSVRAAITRAPAGACAYERVIVLSTDVHEFGMRLVADAVRSLGVEPVRAGTGVDPDEVADLALECDAQLLLVSTHNGMAYTYGRQLKAELDKRRLATRVVFGGVLNEDFEGSDMPLDVTGHLEQMGFGVCLDPAELPGILAGTP
jgi:methylmalonyl-CoA mutase cobalamin-binding subunit